MSVVKKRERKERNRGRGMRAILALVAERAEEASQALTVTRDVVTGPSAVHTLWA